MRSDLPRRSRPEEFEIQGLCGWARSGGPEVIGRSAAVKLRLLVSSIWRTKTVAGAGSKDLISCDWLVLKRAIPIADPTCRSPTETSWFSRSRFWARDKIVSFWPKCLKSIGFLHDRRGNVHEIWGVLRGGYVWNYVDYEALVDCEPVA